MRLRSKKSGLQLAAIIVPSALVVVAVFVGLILGITYYSIYKSDAAETGRQFLRKNEKLKQEIGEVKEFGRFITGHVRSRSDTGQASLTFKVVGERKTVTATVSLVTKDNRMWRVTEAEYVNDQGRRVMLFDPYEPIDPEPEGTPPPTATPTPTPARN
jgi:hypothetical protein